MVLCAVVDVTLSGYGVCWCPAENQRETNSEYSQQRQGSHHHQVYYSDLLTVTHWSSCTCRMIFDLTEGLKVKGTDIYIILNMKIEHKVHFKTLQRK